MQSISLALAGQVSEPIEVGPGARVTATGSGRVEWAAGTLADARNGVVTWQNWPRGASVGVADTLRRVLIRGVATGALTIVVDEGFADPGEDTAYWQQDVQWITDANGNPIAQRGPRGERMSVAGGDLPWAALRTARLGRAGGYLTMRHHPSPPTLTLSEVWANSAIPGSQRIAQDVSPSPYTYFGARALTTDINAYVHASAPGSGGAMFFVEFCTDAPDFELFVPGVATAGYAAGMLHPTLRLWVDGQFVPFDTQFGAFGDYWLRVQSGSRVMRTYTVYCNRWKGVMKLPADSLWPSLRRRNLKAAYVGDSWVVGPLSTGYAYGIPLSMRLGIDDFVNFGSNGTGFVANGVAPLTNYFNRLPFVAEYNPDIIFFAGSLNDTASASILRAQAVTTINHARELMPNAAIAILGHVYATMTGATQGTIDADAALTLAAQDTGVPYISNAGWVTGTGTEVATTGVGNADFYRRSDGNHYNPAGHEYLAARYEQELRSRLLL
jgi:lysophospholipase L1-like esterase